MKTITDREADEWIANMTPEQIRQIVQEHYALKQALCYQTLYQPTGADDWIERSIAAARRLKTQEQELRKLLNAIEAACVDSRQAVQHTTCTNCMGSGIVRDNSCCICRGTGLRSLL
jgi:peptidoglycan/xylan/chitin deacetylase (PgdA/CDA1 family)